MKAALVVSHDSDFLAQLTDSMSTLADSPDLVQARDVTQAALCFASSAFDCCLIDYQLPLVKAEAPETLHSVKLAMLLERRYPELPIFLLANLSERSDRRPLGANLENVFYLNRPRTQDEFRALSCKLADPAAIFSEFTGRREIVLFDERSNVVEAYGSSEDLDRAGLNATLRFNSKQIGQAFLEELPTSIVAVEREAKLSLTFTPEIHVFDHVQPKHKRRNVLTPELLHAVLPREHLGEKEHFENRGMS